MRESVREGNSGTTAVPFDWKPRALLHNGAHGGLPSMGHYRAWAMPRWAAPMRCACAHAGVAGVGRAAR